MEDGAITPQPEVAVAPPPPRTGSARQAILAGRRPMELVGLHAPPPSAWGGSSTVNGWGTPGRRGLTEPMAAVVVAVAVAVAKAEQ